MNKSLSAQDRLDMSIEIEQLIKIGAVKRCYPCQGQYLSGIFLVTKSNGRNRFILNLKQLNHSIPTSHFKLEDYRTVMRLITKDCYMCTLDLKDAYFSVAIHSEDRKYLRFHWLGAYYEFKVLPFGLNIAPYVFTKIMRPVMQNLRDRGFLSVIYLDDIYLMGDTYKTCLENFQATRKLLESLGFVVNMEKSNFTPSQVVKFLGFLFDSRNLTMSITDDKRLNIKKELLLYSTIQRCKLRKFAHFIGLLVSACPAIKYGWLYTKSFERVKFLYLKRKDDYDQIITLPAYLKEDFDWWILNIDRANNPIRTGDYCFEIYSDASRSGWGISCESKTASGLWSVEELKSHINYLELMAAFFGLKIFAKDLRNCEILLRIDNTTAISYINRMGGIQFPHLNTLSKHIWQWCEARNIFLFASYIKSNDNVIADAESRRLHADVEWELADYAFTAICKKFSIFPDIDLFASRINRKCKRFVSWHRDPDAFQVDAFTISWCNHHFYAFPPFCLVLRVLQKIINDKAEGIVVVPKWPMQPWYPLFKKLLISELIEFAPNELLLSSPFSAQHSLHRSLTMVAGVLSGRGS